MNRTEIKKLFIFVFLFFLCGGALSAQVNVAYVNSDQIRREYAAAQDVQKELEDMNRQWDTELQELNRELQKLREELNTRSLLYSDEKKREINNKINTLLDQIRKFQRDKWGENGEYFRKQEELLRPVFERIKTAIDRISEEKDLDIVFDTVEGNILFAKPGLDITKEVLDLLRSE